MRLRLILLAVLLTLCAVPAFGAGGRNGGIVFLRGLSIESIKPDGTDPVEIEHIDGCSVRGISVSRDGHRIAEVDTCGDNFQVKVLSLDGAAKVLTSSTEANANPVWSPDGSRIAFSRVGDDGSRLWVMDADGTHAAQITTAAGIDDYPSFSPDGSRIAYVHENNVWIVGADGTDPTQLTSDGSHQKRNVAFSPDGSQIIFTRYTGGPTSLDIASVKPDGTGDHPLTADNAGTDEQAAFSPDGSRIVFVSYREGKNGLFVMNADGSAPTRISGGPATDSLPSWGAAYDPGAAAPTPSPTPAATASPTPSPSPSPSPSLPTGAGGVHAKTLAADRKGRIRVKVTCPARVKRCIGTLVLKRGKRTVAKSKRYTVAAGTSKTVKLTLAKKARKKKIKLTLVIGGKAQKVTVKRR